MFKALGVLFTLAAMSPAPASASETVSYSYDALGRLTGSSTSGGPNSGISTSTSFDPSGNRSGYTVSGASAAQDAGPRSRAEGGSIERVEMAHLPGSSPVGAAN